MFKEQNYREEGDLNSFHSVLCFPLEKQNYLPNVGWFFCLNPDWQEKKISLLSAKIV